MAKWSNMTAKLRLSSRKETRRKTAFDSTLSSSQLLYGWSPYHMSSIPYRSQHAPGIEPSSGRERRMNGCDTERLTSCALKVIQQHLRHSISNRDSWKPFKDYVTLLPKKMYMPLTPCSTVTPESITQHNPDHPIRNFHQQLHNLHRWPSTKRDFFYTFTYANFYEA